MSNFHSGNSHPSEQAWLRALTTEPATPGSESDAEPIPVPDRAEVTAPISRPASAEEQLPTETAAGAQDYLQAYRQALRFGNK